MEDELENDTPKNETGTETPETPEGENLEKSTEVEKPEQSKELQSALAQKEHFREKFETSQKELEELKKNPNVKLPASQNPMEVVKLAKALEGYNEEEVEFITRNASDDSIGGVIEATKDEWVKTAIQAKREKVVKEKQIPEPSTKQDFSEKPFREVTPAELDAMSVKDKEEYLTKMGLMG